MAKPALYSTSYPQPTLFPTVAPPPWQLPSSKRQVEIQRPPVWLLWTHRLSGGRGLTQASGIWIPCFWPSFIFSPTSQNIFLFLLLDSLSFTGFPYLLKIHIIRSRLWDSKCHTKWKFTQIWGCIKNIFLSILYLSILSPIKILWSLQKFLFLWWVHK